MPHAHHYPIAEPHRARAALAGIMAVAVLAALGCRPPSPASPPASTTEQRVANLHAFAVLYGAVRWFHPSDAAAATDWDRFARDGVNQVADAPDPRALRDRLRVLFKPVAPRVEIVAATEPFATSETPSPGPQTYWEHRGFGDTLISAGYASKRHGVAAQLPGPVDGIFASLVQVVDAAPLRGKRVRLRGKLRAHHGRAQLWMRVDREHGRGFFDNMMDRPVLREVWTEAEVVGTVDQDANQIAFGVLSMTSRAAWYDDLDLAAESSDGSWTPIAIANGGFEQPALQPGWHPGVRVDPPEASPKGWTLALDHRNPASGQACLRIEVATQTVVEELFPSAPAPGEATDLELGLGLRARVPISLPVRQASAPGQPPAEPPSTEDRPEPSSPRFDPLTGTADVIVFWNVFAHFWSYWRAVDTEWTPVLDTALRRALQDRNADDHLATIERLSAAAPDGHVSVSCPGTKPTSDLPLKLEVIEGHVVVTESLADGVDRGDIVDTVDGQSSLERLQAEQSRVSGSPQWQLRLAARRLRSGPRDSIAKLGLRRGAESLVVSVRRGAGLSATPPGRAIERLADGVYYIDLSRARLTDLEANMAQLATAPGIVFDVRGRPLGNHDILSHLFTHLDPGLSLETIPLIIRPFSGSIPAAWEDHTPDNMPQFRVASPHFTGRVAFLTGAGAISYAESVMAYVAHYRLGAIVGEATAGTNGDIAEMSMPTGCTSFFTGRRVTMPDGRPFHLRGIEPTIPVSRTIAGLAAGRDEVLDKALDYVRGAARGVQP
jgi:Peptidase family S41